MNLLIDIALQVILCLGERVPLLLRHYDNTQVEVSLDFASEMVTVLD
jgi:hypothetical protein